MEPIEWKLNSKKSIEEGFKKADWGYTQMNGQTTSLTCPLCGAMVPFDAEPPPGTRFVLDNPQSPQDVHIRYHVAMASYLQMISIF